MKVQTFLLLLFMIFSGIVFGQKSNLAEKIGYIENNHYIITVDTLKLKEYWEQITGVADTELTNMEIRKTLTLGDREEDFYMLIAYDKSKKLKMSRYLFKQDNDLYFYTVDLSKDVSDNEMFFCYYYLCYGADDDCFPHVGILENQYFWSNSHLLVCELDSPCKGGITFVPNEH